MKYNKKLLILLSLCTVIFVGSLFAPIRSYNIDQAENDTDKAIDLYSPKTSAAMWLNYPHYTHLEAMCGAGDVIDWSFTGTNTDVGIYVLIMDDLDYAWFDLYDGDLSVVSEYWILSAGTHYSTYGWAAPHEHDNWCLVFWNADPDQENTYLTYNAYITYGDFDISTPSSSTSWQAGTTHNIDFETIGYHPEVEIELVDDYVFVTTINAHYTIPSYSPGGTYSYSWSIPSWLSDSTTYQIKITDYNNAAIWEYSDYFEITASDSITVTSPTSSSSWQAGSTNSITWTSTGSISNVDIHLYYLGGYHSTIASSTSNDGAHSWTLASSYTNYADSYQIRIEDSSASSTNDYSAAYFEITAPDSITVTSPTASSSWQAGSTNSITWISTGSITNVDIDLYYLGSFHSTIASSTSNDGTHSWTLDSSYANYADSYKIRIEDSSAPTTYDYSATYFEITEIPPIDSITVTSPTASSSWQAGSTQSITWTSTGSITNVDIDLYYLGSFHSTIVSSTSNDGAHSWTLDSSYANYADSYTIRIEDSSAPTTYDYSATYFEITAPSPVDSITLTNPTASSSWQAGSTQSITWTSTGSFANVDIELHYLGAYLSTIVSGTSNDGSYSWTLDSSYANYADSYYIRIADSSTHSTYDFSDGNFEITAPSPVDSITVTSPTGSSSWQAGSTQSITWTSTGSITNVDIDLYYLGSFHSTIALSTLNDGDYTWTLAPSYANYADSYTIRIEDTSDFSTYDYSAMYFEITEPSSLTVTSPTEFESWLTDSTHSITWTSMGSIANVDIDLYYLGSYYSSIASSTSNDGSYSWTLASSYANYADSYQIHIEDSSTPSTYDDSVAYFEIMERDSLTVTGPSSMTTWQAGSTQSITWTSTGSIANVDIDLYYLGSFHSSIASGTLNDGTYSWTLDPSYANYGDSYQIRIADSSTPATYDDSAAYFEISDIAPIDSLTVTSPTDFSSWQAGSTQSITWTSTGSIANVDIVLYYLGGYHSTIASNTLNDGTYSWTLASNYANYGDSYQIHIEDSSTPATYNDSAAYFEITAPPSDSITVTSPTDFSSWQAGSTQSINWTSTGSIVNVDIDLYYLGSYHSTIASSTSNDGTYSWTLDSSYANYADSYQIHIEDSSTPSTYDDSPAYFEITAPPADSLTVTSPTANVNIVLYYLGGYHSTIALSILNDGTYSWTLASSYANYADSYQIRIEDSSTPSTYDDSRAYFEITTPAINSITVTSPTGYSSWQAGSTRSITWTSTGGITNVDIVLYYLGSYHSNIVSSTSNDGTYSWTLPSSYANYGDFYKIRIEDSSTPSTYDYSPAYFEITTPAMNSITVISPTGSSSWQAGSTRSITWTSTGGITNVDIDLYYLGVFHSSIVSDTSNDGTYSWTIPSSLAIYADMYQIHIEDSSNSLTYDDSPAYFAINSGGDVEDPAIPGYDLSVFIISLIGISIILLRKRTKKLA